MRNDRDWINTFTGQKFWPCDPRPEEIDIRDIAHALSLQCRFTGHTRQFYSVAQHCVHVAEHVPQQDALWALLHDGAEAYLVDLARPVKHQAGLEGYRDAEARIMRAICERFGLPHEQPASVTEADHRMLVTEAMALMNRHPDWFANWSDLGTRYDQSIVPMVPSEAEQRYLARFKELVCPGYDVGDTY